MLDLNLEALPHLWSTSNEPPQLQKYTVNALPWATLNEHYTYRLITYLIFFHVEKAAFEI